jgi:hypothetical protein
MADLACSSAVGQKFSDLYWVLLQLTKQPLFFSPIDPIQTQKWSFVESRPLSETCSSD